MMALGAAIGILVAVLRIPKTKKTIPGLQLAENFNGLTKLNVLLCSLYALAFGLLGAKLFNIIGNIKNVIDGLISFYELFSSGFMFYGGLFGGAIGILFYCKLFKIKIRYMFDAISIGLPLGQCFGRIGCFLAGCCYGVPTDSVIGVVFKNPANLATPIGIPLVPVQLIESALCFGIFVFLIIYGAKKNSYGNFARKGGSLFALYCILYATGRFIIEFWRGDSVRGFVGVLSWSQFIGIIIFIVLGAVYLWIYIYKKKNIKIDFVDKNFLEN